ncbi:Putative C4-dicarboxylate transporter/malic acid transport protein [Gulosibacter molinativorax]|nr:Putative C4-dicarboxylate transporter/malic acid transport protein [Gulosibacter molinativorax]
MNRTLERADRAVKALSPGYFALVMATGIVSIGLTEAGFDWPGRALLVLAAIAYVVLAALYSIRWFRYPAEVMSDLRNPEQAFGYFTIVAGTGVVATGLLDTALAIVSVALVVLAALLWFVLGYAIPWFVLMQRDGKPILERTNGTWFVWSVASQSLAVGLAGIEPLVPSASVLIGMLAVLSWSVGALLYAGIAVLIILRIVHLGLTPEQFQPPYWVSMGALAISVVAGTGIVNMSATPMVEAAASFIGGTVVSFWCFASWLIPMLLGAGFWRHVLNGIPLRYSPGMWSMVFPLGMFAVASMRLGRVERIPWIEVIGTSFLWIAVLAWLLVAAGLIGSVIRRGVDAREARDARVKAPDAREASTSAAADTPGGDHR